MHYSFSSDQLLSPWQEPDQWLQKWNATSRPFPQHHCLHELFQEQVERTPDGIALLDEEAQLTYDELDRRANRLAHMLQAQGVGPESRVGLCVERSLAAVIGLLAILKAGAAYVPLDPAYPASRLEYMLADSGVTLILTHQKVLPQLAEMVQQFEHPLQAIGSLDAAQRPAELSAALQFWDSTASCQYPQNACAKTAPMHLAYIMYTSGSTGLPKGVPIAHFNLVSFFNWTQSYFGFSPEDRVIQYHSLSFDFSVWEIFEALLAGATLCLVPPESTRDMSALAQYIALWSITVLNMTPSQFDVLTSYLDTTASTTLTTIRTLVIGGEAFPVELAARAVQSLAAECRLFNEYGPTETTISCSIFPISREELAHDREHFAMSLGRPLDNTQVYVLDPHLQPVPPGVIGELYIGGVQLARGYWQRPELTAKSFVPNPFAQKVGERLYKTGDLVRFTAGGKLEFLGRIDTQIKLRGFRIELGEIETALQRYPKVEAGVVMAQEDPSGDKRLVAYLTHQGATPPTPAELRVFLKEHLPEYMIPSAFIALECFPLTSNGKIDRQSLSTLEGVSQQKEIGHDEPRTQLEDVLVEIWAETLKVETISTHDNFFEVGGHSYLAAQLMKRIHEILQIQVPLQVLFEGPTVAQMATKILSDPAMKETVEAVIKILEDLADTV